VTLAGEFSKAKVMFWTGTSKFYLFILPTINFPNLSPKQLFSSEGICGFHWVSVLSIAIPVFFLF
jgi:hypothetical protein